MIGNAADIRHLNEYARHINTGKLEVYFHDNGELALTAQLSSNVSVTMASRSSCLGCWDSQLDNEVVHGLFLSFSVSVLVSLGPISRLQLSL